MINNNPQINNIEISAIIGYYCFCFGGCGMMLASDDIMGVLLKD
jgi:hypothetical protein